MLALRGLPSDKEPTIRSLAERLQIQHHSAVELVDRMESGGFSAANAPRKTAAKCTCS
jgi:DNA-binding MarR family transcriptional regulator